MGVLIKIPGATFTDEKYIIGKVEIPEVVCDHAYDNDCDTTCNLCGATRTTTHNFVDGVCTICGATDFSDIKGYPVKDTLKGLYDLGGTAEASVVNHAPEQHINTDVEKINGTYEVEDGYITFNGDTGSTRMLTYLRLPLANAITYVMLFRVPSGSRVLIGNRSGTSGGAGNGANLRNDAFEFGLNGTLTPRTFPAINSENFAILAMTAEKNGLRVVRYTNGNLIELGATADGETLDTWASGSSGNAVQIGGYGKSTTANANADIALAAIHTGVLEDDQLTEICKFVKGYGEYKGLTIE